MTHLHDRLAKIPKEAFYIYAMNCKYGPNFNAEELVSAWANENGSGFGAVLKLSLKKFSIIVLRRREDFRLIESDIPNTYSSANKALRALRDFLNVELADEKVPEGERRRQNMLYTGKRRPSDMFKILSETLSHKGALIIAWELYLSLPQPDPNFISDFQTLGFDSRLWELFLFACFKEQALEVAQDVPSPDFLIIRDSAKAFVEAVTANPTGPGDYSIPKQTFAPTDINARVLGSAATRYASALRSKLMRRYDLLPEVVGTPFAIAIADFHAGGSMMWSRESLISYLYGMIPRVSVQNGIKTATIVPVNELISAKSTAIRSGFFSDPDATGVSAIIFSNAASISKFNRVAIQASMAPQKVTATRRGKLFDRKEGALDPISFNCDINSQEYKNLCEGEEKWCFEMEVFHNPHAILPFPEELLPGATHWRDRDGCISCQTMWKNQILSSETTLLSPRGFNQYKID